MLLERLELPSSLVRDGSLEEVDVFAALGLDFGLVFRFLEIFAAAIDVSGLILLDTLLSLRAERRVLGCGSEAVVDCCSWTCVVTGSVECKDVVSFVKTLYCFLLFLFFFFFDLEDFVSRLLVLVESTVSAVTGWGGSTE